MKEEKLHDLKRFIRDFNDDHKRLPDVADLREFFDKRKKITIQEIDNNGKGKIAIFTFKGESDPVKHLDKAVKLYTTGQQYIEFVDINMDNPWIRIVFSGIEL